MGSVQDKAKDNVSNHNPFPTINLTNTNCDDILTNDSYKHV